MDAIAALQTEFAAKMDGKERLGAERRVGVIQKAAIFIKSELQRAILSACDKVPKGSMKAAVRTKLITWANEYLQSNGRADLLE
jgi:hypothetical protein